MAANVLEFRISGWKILVGLLLTVAPVSIVSLYTATRTGRAAEEAAGENLRVQAEGVATQVRERIRTKVIEAALMASDSAVLEAVKQGNSRYHRVPAEEVESRLAQQDELWATPAGADLVSSVMNSPASAALRRNLFVDPSFLRITVTDRQGATVAASHKTLDYYQADEEYWQNIFVTGRGAISLTDILYDDASKHYYIGVGVPVVDGANLLIGTLDALVDVSALFPLVRDIELGPSGRSALVKSDGSVIIDSDGVSLADSSKSSDYAAVLDRGDKERGRSSGYLMAGFPDEGDWLIAYADTGLASEYRELDWSVVAASKASVALAGSSATQFLIMGIALVSLAGIVLFGVYLALHSRSEIEELDEEMRRTTQAAG